MKEFKTIYLLKRTVWNLSRRNINIICTAQYQKYKNKTFLSYLLPFCVFIFVFINIYYYLLFLSRTFEQFAVKNRVKTLYARWNGRRIAQITRENISKQNDKPGATKVFIFFYFRGSLTNVENTLLSNLCIWGRGSNIISNGPFGGWKTVRWPPLDCPDSISLPVNRWRDCGSVKRI